MEVSIFLIISPSSLSLPPLSPLPLHLSLRTHAHEVPPLYLRHVS